jgi:hypothetical protein
MNSSNATKETGVFESPTAPLAGHFRGSEKLGLFCWITVAVGIKDKCITLCSPLSFFSPRKPTRIHLFSTALRMSPPACNLQSRDITRTLRSVPEEQFLPRGRGIPRALFGAGISGAHIMEPPAAPPGRWGAIALRLAHRPCRIRYERISTYGSVNGSERLGRSGGG